MRVLQDATELEGEGSTVEPLSRDRIRIGADSFAATGNVAEMDGSNGKTEAAAAKRAQKPSEFEQLPGCLGNFSDSVVLTSTSLIVAVVILSLVFASVRANGDVLFPDLPIDERYTGRYAGEPWWGRNYTASTSGP
jgi:hypothetical protein|eukprot:COSAG02_NODE_145_length_34010_cov_7.359696_9_plen_136_part_00